MTTYTTHSEDETVALGRRLGEVLRAGDVVLLEGPLGAGKTALARGMAAGLGCEMEGVSSPTFTIIQAYPGPVTLQHVDLYRLAPAEVDDLALDDLMENAVMAVEWPDRWRDAPANAVIITITQSDDDTRRFDVDDQRSMR